MLDTEGPYRMSEEKVWILFNQWTAYNPRRLH